MDEENEERVEEGGPRRNLVDADQLVPDAVVAARQAVDFPTLLLRGYVGEVGERIKLFPDRTADSWTEIDPADIVGAVQSSGDGESTLIVRRDAPVLYASAGKLSGLEEAGLLGMDCTTEPTSETECRGGLLYCKSIRRCSYRTLGGIKRTERDVWFVCGDCPTGGDGLFPA